jgi:hypothetical protein
MKSSKEKFVSVSLPSIPKDTEIEVLYLGIFKNGVPGQVSDDLVAHWEDSMVQTWPDDGVLHVGVQPEIEDK